MYLFVQFVVSFCLSAGIGDTDVDICENQYLRRFFLLWFDIFDILQDVSAKIVLAPVIMSCLIIIFHDNGYTYLPNEIKSHRDGKRRGTNFAPVC